MQLCARKGPCISAFNYLCSIFKSCFRISIFTNNSRRLLHHLRHFRLMICGAFQTCGNSYGRWSTTTKCISFYCVFRKWFPFNLQFLLCIHHFPGRFANNRHYFGECNRYQKTLLHSHHLKP